MEPVVMDYELKDDLTSWLFDILPVELTFTVFYNLDDKTLLNCNRVSKSWYCFFEDNQACFYKDKILSHWPHLEKVLTLDSVKKLQQISLKRFFMKRCGWCKEISTMSLEIDGSKWKKNSKDTTGRTVELSGFHDGEIIRSKKPWISYPTLSNNSTIFYFEVTLLNAGPNQACGVGIGDKFTPNHSLPGWNRGGNTCGYHGDNGLKYFRVGHGKPFGSTYTTGDVIGCGYDTFKGSVFFTKNGELVGTAYTDVPYTNYYPMIGSLETCKASFNFGQVPFAFDIDLFHTMKNLN